MRTAIFLLSSSNYICKESKMRIIDRQFTLVLRLNEDDNLVSDKTYTQQPDGLQASDWINGCSKPVEIEAIFDDGVGKGYPFEIVPDFSQEGRRILKGKLLDEAQEFFGFRVSLIITEYVHADKKISYGFCSTIHMPKQATERSKSLFRK